MKQNPNIITQILIPPSFCSLLMSSLFSQTLVFYLSQRMALSRADRETAGNLDSIVSLSRKAAEVALLPRSLFLLKGKYGVSSLLDVWVQPVTM